MLGDRETQALLAGDAVEGLDITEGVPGQISMSAMEIFPDQPVHQPAKGWDQQQRQQSKQTNQTAPRAVAASTGRCRASAGADPLAAVLHPGPEPLALQSTAMARGLLVGGKVSPEGVRVALIHQRSCSRSALVVKHIGDRGNKTAIAQVKVGGQAHAGLQGNRSLAHIQGLIGEGQDRGEMQALCIDPQHVLLFLRGECIGAHLKHLDRR